MRNVQRLGFLIISFFFLLPMVASGALLTGGDVFHEFERSSIGKLIQLDPSPVTGAYTYSVPLTLPLGRAGLTPELSLSYTSQPRGQISTFGYGWSLSIPYVERIPRDGTDTQFDDNVFFSTLDGELKPLTSSPTEDEYGALVDTGAFNNYEFVSGDYWIMTDKFGTEYRFGTSSATQIVDAASSTRVFRWALQETKDTNGNVISYDYTKDGGQLYPDSISYVDDFYAVDFTLENRNDKATSSIAGFAVHSAKRVSKIEESVGGSWTRKYDLAYTAGDNGVRSMLGSVTDTGRAENLTTTALPALSFEYTEQDSTPTWTQDTGYTVPEVFIYNGVSEGVRIADVNGDALLDILRSYDDGTWVNKVYINDGDDTGWTEDTGYSIPVRFIDSSSNDTGTRIMDVNGDGFADIVRSVNDGSTTKKVYINDGDDTGWTEDTNFTIPVLFTDNGNVRGVTTSDVDGDGLADIVESHWDGSDNANVYINDGDGTGWTADSNYSVPVTFVHDTTDRGVRMMDVNGDALPDIVRSWHDGVNFKQNVYINDGNGTGWTEDTNYVLPTLFVDSNGNDQGVRVGDANGDGLPDLLRSYHSGSTWTNKVYINDGDGTGWTEDADYSLPLQFVDSSGNDTGTRVFDVDGDLVSDVVQATWNGSTVKKVYIGDQVTADILDKVTLPTGGTIDVEYTTTANTLESNGDLSNPTLPINILVASSTTRDSGFGAVGTKLFHYGRGEYFYNDEYDRKFAGFATTTETDELGNVTVTNFHQGNGSQTSIGENSDHRSKIGSAYRVEEYDDENDLYRKTITRIENTDLGNDRDFVRSTRDVVFSYDGDADHKDLAVERTHSTSNGNLTQEVQYGEVTGSDNGTFTDTGSDKRTRDITYASSGGSDVTGLPSTETAKNNGGTTVAEIKHYYDDLAHGSVDEGNATKEEYWVSGSTYVDIERTFNTYGLVTQDKDERDKATNYVIDAHNLYQATTTDPEGLVTERTFDYSSGQVKQLTDPNDLVFETTYDGLDRPLSEKIPDHLGTPSNLVTKTEWAYTDTVGSRRVHQTDYLSGSLSKRTYTYLDGFDREIQTREEMESNYAVRDTIFDAAGNVSKSSLPYESSGTTRTTATTDADLLVTHTYEALDRVKTEVDTEGTTSHFYDQWEERITDREGNKKDYHTDPFGNLVKVQELNGASTYDTIYDYDALDNLIKIIDELGNVRNFTYDGLSRLTNSEDLHDSADSGFGDIDYTYDAAGNRTSKVDAKSQTVNYTFDDNNRILTENYTGAAGTEITYAYDTCSNGDGRLCSITTIDVTTALTYDALGNVKTETRTIDSTNFVTTFTYDRQNNITDIEDPGGTDIAYTHNTAGQLETVAIDSTTVVTDIDYAPTGQVEFRSYANDVDSTFTFDADQLYRLTKISTEYVGGGGGAYESLYLDDYYFLAADIDDSSAERGLEFALGMKAGSNAKASAKAKHPEVRLEKWDSNLNLGVSYAGSGFGNAENVSNRVEWKGAKEEVHAYPKTNIFDTGVDGFEVEVLLEEKPQKNSFTFNLDEVEDLDFFYQPPLNEEDHPEEDISSCSETECVDAGGNIVIARPEHIVGSYAVYYRNNEGHRIGNENYGTGKAFHIYRPNAFDADGNEVWGTLNFDRETETLSVTIPQSFLANATYPVIVDPTFGYESVGASSANSSSEIGSKFNMPENGTITDIHAYTKAETGTVDVSAAVYSDVSGAAEDLLTTESSKTNTDTTASWVTVDIDDLTATSGTDYWILAGSAGRRTIYWDSGATNQYVNEGMSGAGWEDPMDGEGYYNRKTSTYATYTTGGGASTTTYPNQVDVIQDINYTYDNEGNITDIVDHSGTGAGKDVNFGYDDLYRLTSAATVVASSSSYSRTYAYNAIGNLTNKSDQGSYSYAETGYANPHAATSIGGDTVSYDNNGNVTSYDGWTYTWDYRNRLLSAANGVSTTTYLYDHNNLRTEKTVDGATTIYANQYYNETGGSINAHVYAGDTPVVTVTASSTGSGGNGTFGHNTVGVSSANSSSEIGSKFTMPEAGTITDIVVYTKAAAGTVDVSAAIYSDDAGTADKLLVSEESLTTTGTAAGWVEVDIEDYVAASGTELWILAGSAAQRTVYWDSGGTDQYVNEGMSGAGWEDPMSGEGYYDRRTSIYAKYTTSGGGGRSTSTEIMYLHSDHLGGTNVVTNSDGDVVAVTDYYPFGEQRIAEGNFDEQRKFTGHEFDENANLTYAKARYLAQDTGRWISQDPIWSNLNDLEEDHGITLQALLSSPQTLNTYSYARNNPTNLSDPSGELPPLFIATLLVVQLFGVLDFAVDTYELELTTQYPEAFSETEVQNAKAEFGLGLLTGGLGTRLAPIQQFLIDVAGLVTTAIGNAEQNTNTELETTEGTTITN